MTCDVVGCDGSVRAKSYCPKHYSRFVRTGDPLGRIPRKQSHGIARYSAGCRCDVCVQAKRQKRARAKERRLADGDIPHGTVSGYNTFGCRCEMCMSAHRADMDARRERIYAAENTRRLARRGTPVPSGIKHGYSAFNAFHCRCDVCTSAEREAKDRRVQRDREAQGHLCPRSGYQWTGPELEVLVTRTDLTDRELAVMLGRTVWSISTAKSKARHDPKWMKVAGVETA